MRSRLTNCKLPLCRNKQQLPKHHMTAEHISLYIFRHFPFIHLKESCQCSKQAFPPKSPNLYRCFLLLFFLLCNKHQGVISQRSLPGSMKMSPNVERLSAAVSLKNSWGMTRGVRRGCGLIYKGLAININQLLYLSGFIYLPIMQLAMTTAALLLSFAGSLSCLLSKCRFLESNFLFLFPIDNGVISRMWHHKLLVSGATEKL